LLNQDEYLPHCLTAAFPTVAWDTQGITNRAFSIEHVTLRKLKNPYEIRDPN